MKGRIMKRIEIVEKEVNVSRIDEGDKIIMIVHDADDKVDYDRMVQERMAKLREKYGQNISEDDFQIVNLRIIYQEEKKGCRHE